MSPVVGLQRHVSATDTAVSLRKPHLPPPLGQTKAEEVLAIEGEYALNYENLRPIGKGAFGFVWMARKLDGKDLVYI